MLTCPNCGAPAKPESVECAYCKVALATFACPSCFARVFQGSKHCAYCGASCVEVAGCADGKPCPRCGKALEVTAIGSAMIDACSHCGGLWVDVETFRQIFTTKEIDAAVLGDGSPLPSPARPAVIEKVSYIPCPACGQLMNRVNFGRASGVIVDVCKGHGTWFDYDELRRVVEFIRQGGLELMRQRNSRSPKPSTVPALPCADDGELVGDLLGLISHLF